MTSIDIDGLHASYAGPTAPRVLIVAAHGLCLSSAAWARSLTLVRHAAPGVATLAYDHRDHGRSTSYCGPNGEYLNPTLDSVTDDLITVLEHAETICDSIVVVGHSLGAMAMLNAGATHKLSARSIRAMALFGASSGSLCDHGLLQLLPTSISAHLPELAIAHPRLFDLAWKALRPGLSPWLGAQAPNDAHPSPRPAASALASLLSSLRDFELDGQLLAPLSAIPTTVVCGERDLLTPVTHSRRIAERIAGSVLVQVPRGGHNLPMEAIGAIVCAQQILNTLAPIYTGGTPLTRAVAS